MAITLSYRDIDSKDLHQALTQIDNCTTLSVKTMCHFNKFKKRFDEELESFLKLARKIHDKYAVKGEDGKILEPLKYTDTEARDQEMEELWKQTFNIEVGQVKLSEVLPAKLSPKMVRALDAFLIDDSEAIERGPKLVKGS